MIFRWNIFFRKKCLAMSHSLCINTKSLPYHKYKFANCHTFVASSSGCCWSPHVRRKNLVWRSSRRYTCNDSIEISEIDLSFLLETISSEHSVRILRRNSSGEIHKHDSNELISSRILTERICSCTQCRSAGCTRSADVLTRVATQNDRRTEMRSLKEGVFSICSTRGTCASL